MGILPIGFFAPLPLAIMIPFMAAQSFAMGHAFGTSFQYGKRKISSMTNEEFNALSATDLHGELQADIRAMIPDMNQSFKMMEQFQIDIINSMVNTLKLAAAQFFEWITTGKVISTEQTSASTEPTGLTSFYDYGEGGEAIAPPITTIQGGGRYEPGGSYIPQQNEPGYYEYLKSIGNADIPAGSQIIPKKYIKTYKPPYQYDPYKKSGTPFASNEVKAQEKKAEVLRLLKNVGNLTAKLNNIKVQISISISQLDTRDKSIQNAVLIKLKKQRNNEKDLKKKLSNTMIQYKNAQRSR